MTIPYESVLLLVPFVLVFTVGIAIDRRLARRTVISKKRRVCPMDVVDCMLPSQTADQSRKTLVCSTDGMECRLSPQIADPGKKVQHCST
jgi:hypothetical protein